MELRHARHLRFPAVLPAVLGLSACGGTPPPQQTQVIVQSPPTTVVPMAPMPPPPPMSELVPPPPVSSVPTVWQPGHWRYSGIGSSPWNWQSGQYVAVPHGGLLRFRGQWQQQGSGWIWQEGHWA
jgi:hypothetical protein